jgi:hypothetical protein
VGILGSTLFGLNKLGMLDLTGSHFGQRCFGGDFKRPLGCNGAALVGIISRQMLPRVIPKTSFPLYTVTLKIFILIVVILINGH